MHSFHFKNGHVRKEQLNPLKIAVDKNVPLSDLSVLISSL